MEITIGGRKQITAVSLLVPPKEDAWIEFSAESWNVRIHVVFVDDPESKEQGFTLKGVDDHALLTINNWNTGLPSAIEQPFTLGEINGKKILFIFTGYAVGGFKRMDFSFFWEAPNGN